MASIYKLLRHLFLCLLLLLSTTLLPAYAQDVPPLPEESAFISDSAVPGPQAAAAIEVAMTLLGTEYQFGGNSPDTGFDCSGFVIYVFEQAWGLSLPRTSAEISSVGAELNRAELQPGDLVFYNTLGRKFSHVGIYLGDNKFIHSPRKGSAVRIEDMRTEYWVKRFNGARRLDAQTTPAP